MFSSAPSSAFARSSKERPVFVAPASLSAVSTTFVTSSSLFSHSRQCNFAWRKHESLFLRQLGILHDLPGSCQACPLTPTKSDPCSPLMSVSALQEKAGTYASDLPASCRTMSSRSSAETTPSLSTSKMAKMRRSLSSLLARLLQAFSACTNSCTVWDGRLQRTATDVASTSHGLVPFTSIADWWTQSQRLHLP